MSTLKIVVLLCIGLCVVVEVTSHGRLVKPPSRGSMWRYGFDTPVNYNDNELNCGGFHNQWNNQGGECGLCGDPYEGERAHEAGGEYATGTIAACYVTSVSSIEVVAELTSNHKGYFEFRLCENNNISQAISQECLDEHVLNFTGTADTRGYITSDENREFSFHVDLPKGVTCQQCVLQWKYNAGNSWGCDGKDDCCIGCGQQEQFYGCADIQILDTCPFTV
ncbi:uncharacterized protein [Argopecten irradians]|uniref:uncharacterized protein n=1 Tax=Argopecten irradians TaxID=31199 RepID=UPI003715736C